jgi:FdhD protein
MTRGTTPALVRVLDGGRTVSRSDVVVTEEPLEIRLASARGETRTVGITMRTPGADFELAAGFLRTEGVIAGHEDVRRIAYCVDAPPQRYNVVTVTLAAAELPELTALERYGTVTSACGVCGKASLEALEMRGVPILDPASGPAVDAATLYGLPDALRIAQATFAATGGLHAAGLFSVAGEVGCVREDVGRHNAVDKAIGWSVLGRQADLAASVLVVSGRAGFEIVQKAAAAGIPIVCAVSAPSSLAVDTATRFGITLVAFLRGNRANIYSGAERVLT